MPPQPKRTVRARKITLFDDGYYMDRFSNLPSDDRKNHFALPADAESYAAMVEQMALSSLNRGWKEGNGRKLKFKNFIATTLGAQCWSMELEAARQYLAAIGIRPIPQRKGA